MTPTCPFLFTHPAVDKYDVFEDGFLLAKVTDPVVSATSLNVVLHWVDELKSPAHERDRSK